MDPQASLFAIIVIYLAPTIIASCRRHQSALAIGAVNILLGWTLIGYAVAFFWSLSGTNRQLMREVRALHDREISQGRFISERLDSTRAPTQVILIILGAVFIIALISGWKP
jgi:hypothetical protein